MNSIAIIYYYVILIILQISYRQVNRIVSVILLALFPDPHILRRNRNFEQNAECIYFNGEIVCADRARGQSKSYNTKKILLLKPGLVCIRLHLSRVRLFMYCNTLAPITRRGKKRTFLLSLGPSRRILYRLSEMEYLFIAHFTGK